MSRWYPYQVSIWTWYCTHKYVTTLLDPRDRQYQVRLLAGLGLKYKWDNIYIDWAGWLPLLTIWPGPGYQSFAVINLLRYKPCKENVDKKFVWWQEVSAHLYCLGHTNWSEFVGWHLFYFFSPRPLKISSVSTRWNSCRQFQFVQDEDGKKLKSERLYPANLMGLIV